MESKRVDCTCKDGDGDILCLGGEWGQVDKDRAMEQIEAGTHQYWVPGIDDLPVEVHVVPGHEPPYLRTDPDGTPTNNLDQLPNC